jgi:hypothetical protein
MESGPNYLYVHIDHHFLPFVLNRRQSIWGERVGIEPTTDLFRARHRI